MMLKIMLAFDLSMWSSASNYANITVRRLSDRNVSIYAMIGINRYTVSNMHQMLSLTTLISNLFRYSCESSRQLDSIILYILYLLPPSSLYLNLIKNNFPS
jgi:hypothetical protein